MDRGENAKHNYLSIREYIIRKVSKEVHSQFFPDKPLKEVKLLIEDIHNHQFKDALEATDTYTEVEFSGLGIYKFSLRRARKRAEKYVEMIEALERKETKNTTDEIKLREMGEKLEILKGKIAQCEEFKAKTSKADTRGVEELPDTSKEVEGAH